MRGRTARPVLYLLAIAIPASTLAILGGACGGSSSESPWPIEPETPVLGPVGEDGTPLPLDRIPDSGADAASSVEP